jgi:hypothetical protein
VSQQHSPLNGDQLGFDEQRLKAGRRANYGRSPRPQKEPDPIEPIREVTAIYVDSFFVSVTPIITRLSFAETTNEGESIWRTAVVLPTSDAKELAQVIVDLATKHEEEAKLAKSTSSSIEK